MITLEDIKSLNEYIKRKYPNGIREVHTNGEDVILFEIYSASGEHNIVDSQKIDVFHSLDQLKQWVRDKN